MREKNVNYLHIFEAAIRICFIRSIFHINKQSIGAIKTSPIAIHSEIRIREVLRSYEARQIAMTFCATRGHTVFRQRWLISDTIFLLEMVTLSC